MEDVLLILGKSWWERKYLVGRNYWWERDIWRRTLFGWKISLMEENYISGWKIFSWKKKYLAENFFIRWENIWCETNLAGGDFWRKVREYKSLAHPLPAKAQTFNWWWWWWLVMVIIILCWQFIPLQELAAMAQTLIFHSLAFLLICRLSNYLFFISKKITSYGKIPSFIGS